MEKSFEQFMDLSKRQGKVLICGDEGAGKTLLSTYICIQKMLRGFKDCWKSYELVDKYNALGYKFSKNYEHVVFSNFDINCFGTSIPSFSSYIVDPYRVGLYCEDYETDLLPPFSFVCLTEAQRIFNAYKWQYIRPEIRGYWETSRQAEIELLMDTNQPNLIYSGMRSLCNRVIYLHEPVEEIKDLHGVVKGHKLFVQEFKKYSFFERFLMTNKKDLIKEEYTLILPKCVYQNYDSYQCRLLHLKGRQEQDFNISHFPKIETVEDVENFAENFGLYAKDGYYVKPSELKKMKEEKVENEDDFEQYSF